MGEWNARIVIDGSERGPFLSVKRKSCAQVSMTYIAAVRLAPHDINVNAICPGLVDTAVLRGMLAQRSADKGTPVEDLIRGLEQMVPLGRSSIAFIKCWILRPLGYLNLDNTPQIDTVAVMKLASVTRSKAA